MPLVQFYITSATNNTYFQVPISGKCCVRVLNVQYHDTAAGATSRMIQIQSDSLYFPYSPMRYVSILSNPAAAQSYDNSKIDYHIRNAVFNGQILLNVVDRATGATPVNFQHCLLSLEVEHINEEFNSTLSS